MPESPKKGRCRNCGKPFARTRPWKRYCSEKCRNEYGNYGATPQTQMEARLKSFMRSETFREELRKVIAKEMREGLRVHYSPEVRKIEIDWRKLESQKHLVYKPGD